VDSGDSDSTVKKDIKIHGNLDLDGWDDGNLRNQNLDGETDYGPLASSKICVRDLKDEYAFCDNKDDHLKDLSSIAKYVNGDGVLNNDNIF
jgi:hypothetical protein